MWAPPPRDLEKGNASSFHRCYPLKGSPGLHSHISMGTQAMARGGPNVSRPGQSKRTGFLPGVLPEGVHASSVLPDKRGRAPFSLKTPSTSHLADSAS